MANESLYTGLIKPDKEVVANFIVPSFKQAFLAPEHNAVKIFAGNASVSFPRSSGVGADVAGSETAAYSFASTDVYVQGECLVTAAILRSAVKPSYKQQYFADGNSDLAGLYMEQAKAIGQVAQKQWTDAFTSASNSVGTSGSPLTISGLLEGAYYLESSTKGGLIVPVHAMLDTKQVWNLRNELAASDSAVLANPAIAAILYNAAASAPNGYVGNIMGIETFRTATTAVSGALTGAMFLKGYGFATAYDPNMLLKQQEDVAGQVTIQGAHMFCNSALLSSECAVKLVSKAS